MDLKPISQFWERFNQKTLFPLEEAVGPLTSALEGLIRTWEFVRVEEFVVKPWWSPLGRPPKDRAAVARAFVAKAYFNIPTTDALIDRLQVDSALRRLCGFERRGDVPSESTFSRAFAEFAASGVAQRAHEALVTFVYGDEIVGHISRDSTAIDAREKPAKKAKALVSEPAAAKKKGRPKKGEPASAPEPTRLDKQRAPDAALPSMLSAIPTACDIGAKRNSKGFTETWQGYKLHLDVADTGLPVSAILTSASVHDSQVAIPLMLTTQERTGVVFYELMDSAYDAPQIHEVSRRLGRIPIIDCNPRSNKEKQSTKADMALLKTLDLPLSEQTRFSERTTVERANARVKDEFGGRTLRVRGHAKALTHLMFGVCVLAADVMLRLTVT